MIRRSILVLAAMCLALALCAQNKYNINDNEQILSKNERRCIEQMVDYELAFYNKIFGQGSISREAVKMTIIKDYPTYVFYLDKAGIKANRNSSGVYSSKLNEIVMWRNNNTTTERFLTVCYHEMSHAILHSKMKSPAAWFNEGLASYFGYMKVTPKSIRHQSHRYYEDRVKTLIEIRDLDLKDFITWNGAKFSQVSFSQDGYGYAVAYCMILLLMRNEETLCAIIREIAGGKSSAEAFDICYPGGFSAFEKEFIAKYSVK